MISAIILAAGESKRMGQPKMLLKWGNSTVLSSVIATFQSAGVSDIVVVTGGARELVESEIGKYARTIFNDNFSRGEMLSSLQTGLSAMKPDAEAVLIGLGDQPQVEERCVRLVMEEYRQTGAPIVVPSYQMHRGHPWLVTRSLWAQIMSMTYPESPRDFLDRFRREIHYAEAETPSILMDLDTPEDYLKTRP